MQSRVCGRSWLFWLMLLGDATIININQLKSTMACFWSPQSYANVNVDSFLTIINPFFQTTTLCWESIGFKKFQGALTLMKCRVQQVPEDVVH